MIALGYEAKRCYSRLKETCEATLLERAMKDIKGAKLCHFADFIQRRKGKGRKGPSLKLQRVTVYG